ncbi:MAG: hypothetical protein SXU28_08010 [Pseudomonadota bacterium]|nr:hypothetical protein [Pseudomonadota bacterium]
MAFTTRFQSFVCEGDSISCEVAGFEVIARIVRDDCPDAPDERQDGFWPSLYKDAPGFIGPGNNFRQRFAKAQARAEAVMEAWRQDEWFYCGIVLSVSFEGVELESHAASLWGIEANYPDSDNAYLTDVANELLPEALDAGCAILERLTTRAAAVGDGASP